MQSRVKALTTVGSGGGAGLLECPSSLELNPDKTPWSAVFPLFGRLRRDASVEHMAGVSEFFVLQATTVLGWTVVAPTYMYVTKALDPLTLEPPLTPE